MSLNPQQQLAIDHRDGPLLILAGAGSGKTRVLTQRIATLIQERGVAPHAILAVTFTNKAAREMRERVEKLIGNVHGMWITTFHSAGLRLLRQEADAAGLPRDFVIYDDDDQQKILKAIYKARNLDDKRYPIRTLLTQISRAKDHLLTPAAVAELSDGKYGERTAELYAAYQEELARARAVDFADLIAKPVQLFRDHPEILARYQRRFRNILIDEYQDTNAAQYQLVRLLTTAHDNICVVGDPDQSIYGWRGADIQNILSFESDYPRATVIRLEQNYRSTKNILQASNAVIGHNTQRKPKELWTDNPSGALITGRAHPTDMDEAGWVARKIYQARQNGTRYDAVAIFYRINAQSRVFEEALRRAGMPYTIFGGMRFYERKEVKDLLAYLRLAVNPHDSVGLTRVINVPARGLGATTVERVVERAVTQGRSVYEQLQQLHECSDITPAARGRLREFCEIMNRLQTAAGTQSLAELWEMVLKETGYIEALKTSGDDDSADRIANVEELGRAMIETIHDPTVEGTPLQQFLDQVALVSDIDALHEEGGAVRLMTLHLAKGLEFPIVFLVGMEEGLFPHSRSFDDPLQLEEERRLCYVGMTRAREELNICYAERRRLHGRESYNISSRFLDEIPPECIAWQNDARLAHASSPGASRQSPVQPVVGRRSLVVSRANTSGAFADDRRLTTDDQYDQRPDDERSSDALRVGARVAHPMFGPGIIRKTEGSGEKTKVIIQFDRAGIKTLMVAYANLNVLGG